MSLCVDTNVVHVFCWLFWVVTTKTNLHPHNTHYWASFTVGCHRWVLLSLCLCRGQWMRAFLLGLPDCSSRTPALWHQYSRPVRGHSVPWADGGSSSAALSPVAPPEGTAQRSVCFTHPRALCVCCFGSSSLSPFLITPLLFRAGFKSFRWLVKKPHGSSIHFIHIYVDIYISIHLMMQEMLRLLAACISSRGMRMCHFRLCLLQWFFLLFQFVDRAYSSLLPLNSAWPKK